MKQAKYQLIIYEKEWTDFQIKHFLQRSDTNMEFIISDEMTDAFRQNCGNDSRQIFISCSDAGIQVANELSVPVFAIRNAEYEKRHGRQDLFGTPVLLEEAQDVTMHILELVYCRANGIPMTIGTTKRCIIREISESDIPLLFHLTNGVINEGSPHTLYLSRQEYVDFWNSYIKHQYVFYGYGLWLIEAGDQGIGLVGFSNASYPFLNAEDECMELSYWIAPAYRGRGFALEAGDYLVNHAREWYGLDEIFLFIRAENAFSIRIADQLHFSFWNRYGIANKDILSYRKQLL